jgi:hypothetical protein
MINQDPQPPSFVAYLPGGIPAPLVLSEQELISQLPIKSINAFIGIKRIMYCNQYSKSKETIMEILKEHIDSKYRNRELVRLCKNLFSSIDYHGLTPAVKKDVEQDMVLWNRDYYEDISCDQLVDFIAQVVEGVFGKSRVVSATQGSGIDGDLPPKEGGS